MTPIEVLRFLGGTASRAALLRHATRHSLEQAVQRNEVERLGWGRYGLPGLPSALKSGVALGGVISHESAAQYWKMESLAQPASVHLTVPAHAHRPPDRSITLHYADLAGDGEVTSPIRTVLDCVRTLSFREGLAIADSALRLALLTQAELLEAADRTTGKGNVQARRVARHANGLAANPFESALRAAGIEVGLTGLEPQFRISEDGHAWYVDLADERARLIAEADSFAFHGTPAALEKDCRRYDELVSRGWRVLRYAWEQVVFDETWVKSTLLSAHRLGKARRSGSLRVSSRRRLSREQVRRP